MPAWLHLFAAAVSAGLLFMALATILWTLLDNAAAINAALSYRAGADDHPDRLANIVKGDA